MEKATALRRPLCGLRGPCEVCFTAVSFFMVESQLFEVGNNVDKCKLKFIITAFNAKKLQKFRGLSTIAETFLRGFLVSPTLRFLDGIEGTRQLFLSLLS